MKYKDLSNQELKAVDLILEWAQQTHGARRPSTRWIEFTITRLVKDIHEALNDRENG
jgi:hypothetical protein